MLAQKLNSRKGRERNGKEMDHQGRAYRGEKSDVSRIADARNHNPIGQDALPFYG